VDHGKPKTGGLEEFLGAISVADISAHLAVAMASLGSYSTVTASRTGPADAPIDAKRFPQKTRLLPDTAPSEAVACQLRPHNPACFSRRLRKTNFRLRRTSQSSYQRPRAGIEPPINSGREEKALRRPKQSVLRHSANSDHGGNQRKTKNGQAPGKK